MTTRLDADTLSMHSVGGTVQVVIDTLFQKIKSREYPVDTRLPSERSLAAELGVSRNTVREALDVLETKKIIRRRAGSGSFVTYRAKTATETGTSTVAERTSPLDHLVVRSIIEPEMVRLATINMSPREIEELDDILTRIEQVRNDADEFTQCEEDFYRKIARGTRNPLLDSCYELTIQVCRQSFRSALMRRHLTPDRIQDYQSRYNTLFNAIASRDVEAAVEFIKLHLIEEQKLLLHDT
ncbi:FadR/GntR family transcriptional regulator [Roseinatronobacter alkalisoli]|uniref:FCD domain-containing protein n=1 Tax=Roseinatronobacter alkalisoli TaxID=3028235 RepID=A0ABT5T6I8_9RHOB|nr:FCD domain-containing protein [Roseinatronobacter sp. HJB301]MDD7970717.1 FCD domain-containing protein [Roseinatronobacter sp. HJB301]